MTVSPILDASGTLARSCPRRISPGDPGPGGVLHFHGGAFGSAVTPICPLSKQPLALRRSSRSTRRTRSISTAVSSAHRQPGDRRLHDEHPLQKPLSGDLASHAPSLRASHGEWYRRFRLDPRRGSQSMQGILISCRTAAAQHCHQVAPSSVASPHCLTHPRQVLTGHSESAA